jgi:hypothetical protein
MRWDDIRIVELLRRLNEEMTEEVLAIQAFDEPGRQPDGLAAQRSPGPASPEWALRDGHPVTLRC